MAGVGEAGAQHAFVAGDDDGAVVLGLDVGDEGEPGGGRAVGGAQREVALVDPHRDLHDLGRQVHVLVGDAAEMRDGPFDQAGDFLQQAGIVDDGQRFFGGEAGDAVGDDALAVGGVDQHAAVRAVARCQSAALVTAKAPGAWKRWPSVRLPLARPWPSSAPSRRSNGTTAPSSRQTMRRSGRTQTKLLVPPQRMDFGQAKRRSRPGMAPAIRSAAETAAALFSSTQ